MPNLLSLVVILFILSDALALKILMIQPNSAHIQSHFNFGLNLAKFLAENDGHNVHFLVPMMDENAIMSDKNDARILSVRYFVSKKVEKKIDDECCTKIGPPSFDTIFLEIASNSSIMDELSAEKFDVGIAEAFAMTEYSLTIFHFLRIPVKIATSTMPISPHQFYLLGILSKMATGKVPASSGPPLHQNIQDQNKRISQGKNAATLIGDHHEEQLILRRKEIWTDYVEDTLAKVQSHIDMDPNFQKLAEEKYGIDNFPGLDDIFRKTRFFFVNSQPEVDFDNYKSVIGIEKVKFVGGFNLKPNARELDKKISGKMDAKKGIVLVSFGTVVNTSKAEFSHVIEAIKETIKCFPEFLFVWKMDKGDQNIQKICKELQNVYSTDWVDQQGILANPRTLAFVSHCGMNSVLEGIFNGVPMICVPFFGDQFYNAESLARQQIGLVVDRDQVKDTIQHQLTVALGKTLEKNESNEAANKIDMGKLKTISSTLQQKNISNVLSEAFRVIEDEIGATDPIEDLKMIIQLLRSGSSYEPGGWPQLIV